MMKPRMKYTTDGRKTKNLDEENRMIRSSNSVSIAVNRNAIVNATKRLVRYMDFIPATSTYLLKSWSLPVRKAKSSRLPYQKIK
jgi:hypothetical protein